jgi:amidophosphoribosyltransferase
MASHLKEACGVFGVYAPGHKVAQLAFDGLYALQHRGQESAGIAVSDRETITVVKDMGLVANVFDDRALASLAGDIAIGHTRYSTAGASSWWNAQPVYRSVGPAGFALGHNGNLTNTKDLAAEHGLMADLLTSDSDLMAELIATAGGFAPEDASVQLVDRLKAVLPSLRGAFSLVLMDRDHLIGVRDPNGFRPLCLGRLGDGYVLASETPALDVIGARLLREVEPGEMVLIGPEGLQSSHLFSSTASTGTLCLFEFVYFARPDSLLVGREVHGTRRRMGERLARQHPVEADMVMGVPDSGVPAAEGYSLASGIPFGQGLVKNRYIGRTFITPSPEARALGVRRKLNPLRENIAGKRLVVVDDSVVRGTTTKAMVQMLRESGAREIHLRISSPPYLFPCFYGIDTPSRDDLLAAHRSVAEIGEYLGADSIDYLTLENLLDAIGCSEETGFCDACLTGNYPVPVPVPVEVRSVG